jgi:predicted glycosyltransferase
VIFPVRRQVFIISQHSVGMGHLSRSTALAAAMAKGYGHRVTLFSGGRQIPGYVPPEGVNFIQLPVTERTRIGGVGFSALDSTMPLALVEARRSDILVEQFRLASPDAIIIEHYPFVPERFGQTLLALLEAAEASRPKPRLICSIRTLPISATQAAPEEINSMLRRHFDHVLHHADPRIFPLDSLDAYLKVALDGVPVTQTGFVMRHAVAGRPPEKPAGLLLTVGGGRDGRPFLERWIAAARQAGQPAFFPLRVVCGPIMSPEDRACIRRLGASDVIIHEWLPDLAPAILASRAVVCMGGYNTINEAISLGKPVLAFPRGIAPEQRFQVRTLAEHGLLISAEDVADEARIGELMRRLLDFLPDFIPDFAGAHRSAKIINGLMEATEPPGHGRH